MKRSNYIWRRRLCRKCRAIFTTKEYIELPGGFVVGSPNNKKLEPFSRDHLFLSIYDCCKHRPSAIDDAASLTDTIITKLLADVRGALIRRDQILACSFETLEAFDTTAATLYKAYHPILKGDATS